MLAQPTIHHINLTVNILLTQPIIHHITWTINILFKLTQPIIHQQVLRNIAVQ